MDKFNSFLILTTTRFYENDAWLRKELAQRYKVCYFVRTKIQLDVANKRHEAVGDFSEEKVVENIRRAVSEELLSLGFSCKLFLIDNHKESRHKFDFEDLVDAIIHDLPQRQREAAILSLAAVSQSIIKEKAKQLRERAWVAAIVSACVAAVPVPGLSVVFDFGIILKEGSFYFKQLGLDDKSLKARAEEMSIEVEQLIKIVRREFPQALSLNYVRTIAVGGIHAVSIGVEEVSRFIPVIGSLIAAPISLATTRYILMSMIDRMESIFLELTKWHATSVDAVDSEAAVDSVTAVAAVDAVVAVSLVSTEDVCQI